MNIILRQETKKDFSAVYNLNKCAFGQENGSKLIEVLRKSKAFIPELSIVAIIDTKIVGHILFTKILIRDQTGIENNSLALAPMSVDPKLQKQGIGGQLIRHGLKKAKELGFKSVIVLGYENSVFYLPANGILKHPLWFLQMLLWALNL